MPELLLFRVPGREGWALFVVGSRIPALAPRLPALLPWAVLGPQCKQRT